MATAPRRTTYTTEIDEVDNDLYGDASSVIFPFVADRVTVNIATVTGTPRIVFSLDGINDSFSVWGGSVPSAATTYTLEMQRVARLYWRVAHGGPATFSINAETQAWPTSIG